MIDFNYTAPELLPFRIQEVLDAPNEPHRIGGVVYVPEGGGECEFSVVEELIPGKQQRANICECSNCGYRCAYGFIADEGFKYCPNCGKAVKR